MQEVNTLRISTYSTETWKLFAQQVVYKVEGLLDCDEGLLDCESKSAIECMCDFMET